jgi:predicted PurR-regulated permease PerM
VGIHPATALIGLVAGTELFGLWGALFAAPLAGLIQALLTVAWREWREGDPRAVVQAVVEKKASGVAEKAHVAAERAAEKSTA